METTTGLTHKYKIGDKVKLKDPTTSNCSCDRADTEYLMITDYISGSYCYVSYRKDGTVITSCRGCLGEKHFDYYYKKSTMIKKLSNFIKKTVNSDTQELLKAGLINGDLEPTTEGKNELVQIIWFANLDALVVRAKEINAEAEADSKK